MKSDKVVFEPSHGSSNFPVEAYNCSTSSIPGFIPLNGYEKNFIYRHWHDDIELIYIQQGKVLFVIDEKQIEAHAGQVVIINRCEIHSGHAIDDCECETNSIVFNPSMLCFNNHDICQEKYLYPILKSEYKFPNLISGKSDWEKEIISHVYDILMILKQKPYCYELRTKLSLYKIIYEILYNNSIVESNPTQNNYSDFKMEQLKKVICFIEENFEKKFYIKTLADLIDMSEGNFYTFFKKLTSKTPIEYINCHRVYAAEKLLYNERLSITDISLSVGFESVSYFIKTFKAVIGLSPSKYRKLRCSNTHPHGISG